MGFFSGLGATISGIGHAIGNAISSVCSAIGGALSRAATAISGFVDKIGPIGHVLFPELDLIELVCDVVGAVVSAIAEALGIKEPEQDDPEELGMKAKLAEKKPEDFDSTEEYIKYLHNEVKLDEEKKLALSPEEKAAYSAIGTSLYLDASAEKLGIEKGTITPDFLLDCAKVKMDSEQIIATIKSLKESGLNPQAMSDYMHSNLNSLKEYKQVDAALTDAFKETQPELSNMEIADKLNKMQNVLQGVEVNDQ